MTRQQQSSVPFLTRNKSFVATLLLSVTLGILFIFVSSFFTIQRIVVSGNGRKEIRGLEVYKNQNLLFLSTVSIEQNIRSRNPFLARVQAIKQYPRTLIVHIFSDEPVAAFVVSGGYYLLSSDARIIARIREPAKASYPPIEYYQKFSYDSFKPGDTLDFADIKTALFFLKKMQDLDLVVNSIDINGLNMIVCKMKHAEVIYTTEKNVTMQAYELQTVVRQLKVTGKSFRVLDLRFDKPVITF